MSVLAFPARKLSLFAMLSGADFVLTWHLLGSAGGAAYEGNPLAAWWLACGGWLGLAAFKAASALAAGGLGLLLCRLRPLAGHRVLTFGCAALAAVVLYGGYLCDAARRGPIGLDPDEAAPLLREASQLDAARQRSLAYKEVLTRVVGELRDRRCTLEEAVARLVTTEHGRHRDFLRPLQQRYPGLSRPEALAVVVMNGVAPQGIATAAERQRRHELEAEFRTLYGRAVPGPSD